MERAERLIALALAVLFPSAMIPILWIMLVLTVVTAAARFVKVWRQASDPAPVNPTVERLRARRQARMSRTAARRADHRADRRAADRVRFMARDRLTARDRFSTPRRRTDKD